MVELWRRLRLGFRTFMYILRTGPGGVTFAAEPQPLLHSGLVEEELGDVPGADSDPFVIMKDEGGGLLSVVYKGGSGSEARKTIEGLRSRKDKWYSTRDGRGWDWGPR